MPYAKDKKCWVVGCESSTSVLHYLVQRPDMDEWIERIGRAESKKVIYFLAFFLRYNSSIFYYNLQTMSTRELWSKGVCRRHFAGGFLKGFLKLKAGAVPELFLPG